MIEMILFGAMLAAPAQEQMPVGPAPRGDLVELMRERLGDGLRDPASAEIRITRGLRRSSVPISEGHSFEGYAVCATVNAKNAYGAYVGRQPYVFMWWGQAGRLAAWPVLESSVPSRTDLETECAKSAS